MTLSKRFLQLALGAALAAAVAGAATLTLDDAALAGQPGETVGWGFTITSDSSWILITHADFVLDPGVNPIGVFTPFITLVSQVIGPGEIDPWTQAFDNAGQSGIGSYAINDFQVPGDSATGSIVLLYDEFSVSPNDAAFDPLNDTLGVGESMSAPASVEAVPEPGTWWLVGCVLAICLACRRRVSA